MWCSVPLTPNARAVAELCCRWNWGGAGWEGSLLLFLIAGAVLPSLCTRIVLPCYLIQASSWEGQVWYTAEGGTGMEPRTPGFSKMPGLRCSVDPKKSLSTKFFLFWHLPWRMGGVGWFLCVTGRMPSVGPVSS